MTPQRRRLVRLLCSRDQWHVGEFARAAWPDSDGWDRPSRKGVRGQMMHALAASQLVKLRDAGLAAGPFKIGPHTDGYWQATPEARRALEGDGRDAGTRDGGEVARRDLT